MKVSVVMATFNGERFLDEQIQSILSQTLPPEELIVCDDCSTDATVAILEKYRQAGKLIYHVNTVQLGLVDNFKKAITLAADGNYVALCDQDDLWLPEKLQTSAARLAQIEDKSLPCMVYSDLIFVDEHNQIINSSFRNQYGQDKYGHNLQSLLFSNFVLGCTMLMNPVLARQAATIPQNVRLNHDAWLALVAFSFGKASSVDAPLVRYRKHNNNASIAADALPRSRFASTLSQLSKAINGKDDFLAAQIETVGRFYKTFETTMAPETRSIFAAFLNLQNKPYLIKKLAYRNMVNQFRKF